MSAEYEDAIERLHDAIDAVNKVSGDEGLLMEWVVIEARHFVEDNGDTSTSLSTFGSAGLPFYRKLGLLHVGVLQASGRREAPQE